MQSSQLKVKVYNTRAALGTGAANDVQEKIGELLKIQPFVNIIFAAAPSQNEFLRAFRKAPLDWSRIRAFHMDEYTGLSSDARQGFGNFLKDMLFDKVPFASIYYIDGNAVDLEAECLRYEALLTRFPPDIVCMGIGENGHIAFNDPPVADFSDPVRVKVVVLDLPCRQQQVNDGCFSELRLVPVRAITLTVPALMEGRFIYCIVPGRSKAQAVFNTLNREISEEYPASIIRRHPNTKIYLDSLSAAMLKMV